MVRGKVESNYRYRVTIPGQQPHLFRQYDDAKAALGIAKTSFFRIMRGGNSKKHSGWQVAKCRVPVYEHVRRPIVYTNASTNLAN
jgi:hypothetical protein